MATNSTSTRKAKRRRRPTTEEIVNYVARIENWGFDYWLAPNTLRNPLDPYHEHRHVVIRGRLLRPAGAEDRLAGDVAVPVAEPHGGAAEGSQADRRRGVELHPDRLDASIGIPHALALILQMLIADKFKFAVLRGSKFRYRSARLVSFRLRSEPGKDDLSKEEV